MHSLDALLSLRPSNVANRLRGRSVCVLNSYDVQRAVAEGGGAVVLCELAAPALLAPGVLRAARHLEAVIGIAAPAHERGEGPSTHGFFVDVAAAAEDAGYELPMFLASGPIAVAAAADDAALEQARRQVFEHLDAGFTEISLDVGSLDPAEAAQLCAELGAPVRERELGLEVVAGSSEEEALAALSGELAGRGLRAHVLSVPRGVPEECELGELALLVGPSALGIREPLASHLEQGAARRVAVGERFDGLLESALPAALRVAIDAWREQNGAPLRAALGHFYKRLDELDGRARLKLEALAYHEARELLEAAGARGGGLRAAEFLSERSGY